MQMNILKVEKGPLHKSEMNLKKEPGQAQGRYPLLNFVIFGTCVFEIFQFEKMAREREGDFNAENLPLLPLHVQFSTFHPLFLSRFSGLFEKLMEPKNYPQSLPLHWKGRKEVIIPSCIFFSLVLSLISRNFEK